ncbi:MAG: hypothetical protein ACJ8A6_11840 [Gemmatimonadales bacterium]
MAWELVVRLLRVSGVPLGDLVHLLGTMLVGRAPAWLWWPTGMTLRRGRARGQPHVRAVAGPALSADPRAAPEAVA